LTDICILLFVWGLAVGWQSCRLFATILTPLMVVCAGISTRVFKLWVGCQGCWAHLRLTTSLYCNTIEEGLHPDTQRVLDVSSQCEVFHLSLSVDYNCLALYIYFKYTSSTCRVVPVAENVLNVTIVTINTNNPTYYCINISCVTKCWASST
jgi:hypothetical protein